VAGAFATSLVQSGWTNDASRNRTELAGAMTQGQASIDAMTSSGMDQQTAVNQISGIVEGQSVMLASVHVFATLGVILLIAAALIWLAPKPKGPIEAAAH